MECQRERQWNDNGMSMECQWGNNGRYFEGEGKGDLEVC